MKIALLGDIALIGRYDRTLDNSIDQRIAVIKELVKDCDYVIGNLEAPLTSITRTRVCKGVYLRSDPENVKTLKKIGVTHVTLANNHIYDYGKNAAKETAHVLKKAGIKYVGLNNEPIRIVKDGNSVLLDGYCCLSANALNYGTESGQVKMLTPENIESFLRKAQEDKSLPIASVHFGVEGVHYPSLEHMKLFRMLAEKYDYILHGNHPHAIQGYEQYGRSLLIYAQGNLCFDETPVTSIHSIPKETPEERKNYISIVHIEKNSVISHKVCPLSDLPDGILHIDKSVGAELEKYVGALSFDIPEIQKLRNQDLNTLILKRQVHDLKFYLDRMNYKYLGAYLNGKKHAKQYNKIFSDYKHME